MSQADGRSMRDYLSEILPHGLPARDAAQLCRGVSAAMVVVAIAAFAVAATQCV